MSLPTAAQPAPRVSRYHLTPESQAFLAEHAAQLRARREQLRRNEAARHLIERMLREASRAKAVPL